MFVLALALVVAALCFGGAYSIFSDCPFPPGHALPPAPKTTAGFADWWTRAQLTSGVVTVLWIPLAVFVFPAVFGCDASPGAGAVYYLGTPAFPSWLVHGLLGGPWIAAGVLGLAFRQALGPRLANDLIAWGKGDELRCVEGMRRSKQGFAERMHERAASEQGRNPLLRPWLLVGFVLGLTAWKLGAWGLELRDEVARVHSLAGTFVKDLPYRNLREVVMVEPADEEQPVHWRLVFHGGGWSSLDDLGVDEASCPQLAEAMEWVAEKAKVEVRRQPE